MANEYTPRFQWPIPPWNADWQKWQAMFKTFAQGADATAFAIMEHLTLIHHTLPIVEIQLIGADYFFTQAGAAVFLSRTFQVQVPVGPTSLGPLVPGAIIGASIQAGAVGPQAVDWEQYVSQTDIDPSIAAMGIVNADYSITWFNGARLDVGIPTILFYFSSTGVGMFMSGVGNPNTVPVTALQGTVYRDTGAGLMYMNIDGASTWVLI